MIAFGIAVGIYNVLDLCDSLRALRYSSVDGSACGDELRNEPGVAQLPAREGQVRLAVKLTG